MIEKIPLTLLTGFLGSGKTTLLRQMLEQPGWQDTVVLVNELGEVGLDHHLLWGAGDAVLVLENGCICCSVRDDLVGVLEDLFWKRLHRQIPRFTRVVVETTGLAYPGPIIAALLAHQLVAERYAVAGMLCTIDALLGARQLAQHREAIAQLACADSVIVTKTNLVDPHALMALEAQVRTVNAAAPLQHTSKGQFAPIQLAQAHGGPPADTPAAASGMLYHHRVRTTALHFSSPWRRDELATALREALDLHGDRILRIKGLVALEGEAGPVVVQAVQGAIFSLEQLPSWPGESQASFIVCITTGLADDAIARPFRPHIDMPNLM